MDTERIIYATSTTQDGNLSFRWGSEDTVLENRRRFLNAYGLHLEKCVVMEVEHGDSVVAVGETDVSADPKKVVVAEALITNEKGIALFLLTADCLPIALFDPIREVVALAHLGWKPTGLKLIQKVVRKMQEEFGSDPKDILVDIGPCIHKESYKVEVVEQKNAPEWQPYIETLSSGEFAVDLIGFNKDQLCAVGVSVQNISVHPADTATSDEYFSHYRSVRTGEPEGRFATIVGLGILKT